MQKHQILLYYKYVELESPESVMTAQKELCEKLGLKGRVIIAPEGINGTLEGTVENTRKYMAQMDASDLFTGINWKVSEGNGHAFPKLSVKVRPEIVTTGIASKDFGPRIGVTGTYLSSDELYNWYKSGKEFYIIDMRNDFEYALGRFEKSLFPQGLYRFRDVTQVLEKLQYLKNKTVVTVCTGGVRCETASGLLMKYGFTDVYQLQHGIVTFMEKYPNTYFQGKLYVFDSREAIGFNTDSADHKVIGTCVICQKKSENLVNYQDNGRKAFGIICEDCCKVGTVELQTSYKQKYQSA